MTKPAIQPSPLPTFQPSELTDILTNLPPGVKLKLEILPTGAIAVSQDTTTKTKTDLIEQNYPHLKSVDITISQAAEKYGVPRGAVRNWVYISGDVHFTNEAVYPKLVNEAEVALCARIYHERKKTNTAGLPYFDQQGYEITTVKRPATSRRKKQAA